MKANKIVVIAVLVVVVCSLAIVLVSCSHDDDNIVNKVVTDKWEYNDFTAIVPEPRVGKIDYVKHFKSGRQYGVHITDVTIDEALTYVEALKCMGYRVTEGDIATQETGMIMMRDGRAISLDYEDNSLAIMIAILSK